MTKPELSTENQIDDFMHCALCLAELPKGDTPADYARLSVGFTPRGVQVWCWRHQCNVCNIDFEGQRHPAITARKPE